MDWRKEFDRLLPKDWDEREKLLDKIFNTEPRDFFVELLLLRPMLKIENMLFYEGKWRECVSPLEGVISSLDGEGQEKLKPQLLKLQSFGEGVPCSRKKVERIYQEILKYLRKNWFQGTIFGR